MRSKRKASKLDAYTPSYMQQKPKAKRAKVARVTKAKRSEDLARESTFDSWVTGTAVYSVFPPR